MWPPTHRVAGHPKRPWQTEVARPISERCGVARNSEYSLRRGLSEGR